MLIFLQIAPPRPSNLTVHMNPQLVPQRRPLNGIESESAVERQVSIDEGLLSSERDGNYIDPRHLLSQQPPQAVPLNRSLSLPVGNRLAVPASSIHGGLMSAIDLLKTSSAAPTHNQGSRGQKFGLSARKTSVSSVLSSQQVTEPPSTQNSVSQKEERVVDLTRSSTSAPIVKMEGGSRPLIPPSHMSSQMSSQQRMDPSRLDDWKTVVGEHISFYFSAVSLLILFLCSGFKEGVVGGQYGSSAKRAAAGQDQGSHPHLAGMFCGILHTFLLSMFNRCGSLWTRFTACC
jgi:hypothetical protein